MAVGDLVGGPLIGSGDADKLIGQALVGNGFDSVFDNSSDILKGFGGDDILVGDLFDEIDFDTEGDQIYGGGGNDIIYGDTAPILIGFFASYVGDSLWATRAEGSSDKLYGDGGDDTIYGGAGFDEIRGGTGADNLKGQNDGDGIFGEDGYDKIDGGNGDDLVYGGSGRDDIFGGTGKDRLYGEDFLSGSTDDYDYISGEGGNDDLRGGAFRDTIYGGAGNDYIQGGGLSFQNDTGDFLSANEGDDTVFGNEGNDVIIGGAGLDELSGGTGADRFAYFKLSESTGNKVDVISDFNVAEDRIDVSQVDAIVGNSDPFDGFTFIGKKAFDAPGQLRYAFNDGNTFLRFNTDTDSTPEMVIKLLGLVNLDAGGFLW